MTYIVKKGDRLEKLYGTNWKKLSGYTGDPTKLQIGTKLPDLPGATPTSPPLYPSGSLGNLLNTSKIPSTAKTSANVSSVIQPATPLPQKPITTPIPYEPKTTIGQQYFDIRQDANKPIDEVSLKKEYRSRGFEDKYGGWTGSNEQYKAMWMQDIQEGITQMQDRIAKEGITRGDTGEVLLPAGAYNPQTGQVNQPPANPPPASVSSSGAGTPSYEFNAPSVNDHEKVVQGVLDAVGTTDIGKLIQETAIGEITTTELELSKEDKQAQLDELKSAAAKGLSSIQKSLAQRGMTFSGIRTEAEAGFAADVLAKETGINRDFAGKIINAARQEQGRRERALEVAENNYNEALKSQGYIFNPITNTIEKTLQREQMEFGQQKDIFEAMKPEKPITQTVDGNLYQYNLDTKQWDLTIEATKEEKERNLNINYQTDDNGNVTKIVTDPITGKTVRKEKMGQLGRTTATASKIAEQIRYQELLRKSNNGTNIDALTPEELTELYSLL